MTKAIVLAAGQGTRLRPITDDKPKCLVPLLGKPLLQLQAETLRGCGIDNILVVGGYRADAIENEGFEVVLNPKFESTNMVSSLFSAREALQDGQDIVIAYGDIVYQKQNLYALLNCKSEIALMIDRQWLELWSLRLDDPLSDAETLVVNDTGHVVELGKKPLNYDRINGQYTGLIKVRSDRVSALVSFYDDLDRTALYDGKIFDNMYMTSFLQALIDAGWPVEAAFVENGWLEVDSVEDLTTYQEMAKDGSLQNFFDPSK